MTTSHPREIDRQRDHLRDRLRDRLRVILMTLLSVVCTLSSAGIYSHSPAYTHRCSSREWRSEDVLQSWYGDINDRVGRPPIGGWGVWIICSVTEQVLS